MNDRKADRTMAATAAWSMLIVGVTALILWLMGRPFICTCGTVELWHGELNTAEDSQQLLDWYSFTHVVHGVLFYWALWLLAKWFGWLKPIRVRFLAAMLAESLWELIENTPLIIERYREATIALGYMGDSVINSVSDIICMAIGFALAMRLPVWVTVAVVVAMEVALLLVIRDNLALNILMLLFPSEAIRSWQAG